MCEHIQQRPKAHEVLHVEQLSSNIGDLYENREYSDITFIVEGRRFDAHKVIMAARSEYFRAMLYGGLSESRPDVQQITLQETSAHGFDVLLLYIYTGRVMLSNLQEELVLEVLGLAHRYGFTELQGAISDFLQASLSTHNVCLVYDIASVYSLGPLTSDCLQFIDQHATDILSSDAFLQLSQNALLNVISRDSFCARELNIFEAVAAWISHNSEADTEAVMREVRLPLMERAQLLQVVRVSGLVEAELLLDAILTQDTSPHMQLPHRGFRKLEVNVATAQHGARVMLGEMKSSLLDGDTLNYDLDHGFSRHAIDEENADGIVIKLLHPYILNCVRLLLWDRDLRSYSYCVELSTNQRDWLRVIDYRKFLCRSWQTLYFPPTVAQFIRVLGTHNTVNRVFHLVAFECMYTAQPCLMEDGFVVPTSNVASIEASALVIEGVSRSRNALINGDTRHYDWDSGYTCHQLGSGAIIIQLAQPYLLASMRLLLWDCDDRGYRFYVETSTDQTHWTMAADKRDTDYRTWQTLVFEQRPVCFVRITGTYNSANEVFHIVHFECPCEPAELLKLQQLSAAQSQQHTAGEPAAFEMSEPERSSTAQAAADTSQAQVQGLHASGSSSESGLEAEQA